jgi:hypothetical protein
VPALALLLGLTLQGLTFSQGSLPSTTIPDAQQQAKASKIIQALYGEEFSKAQSKEAKAALARRLHRAALETRFDSAGQYVLFKESLGMYQAILEFDQAIVVARALGARFSVDSLALQLDIIRDCAKSPEARSQLSLHSAALLLMMRAGEADRYDIAEQASSLAEGSPHHKGPAMSLVELIDQQAKAYEKATDPGLTPAERELRMGIYLGAVKFDWPAGLPHLEASKIEPISELSHHDQIGPMTPGARVKLAGRWWDLANKESGITAKGYALRAAHWYWLARPKLAGLDLALAEMRLKEAEQHVAQRWQLAQDLRAEGWPILADHLEAPILWILPKPEQIASEPEIQEAAIDEPPVIAEKSPRPTDPGLARLAETVDGFGIPRQLRLRVDGRRQLTDRDREGAIQAGLTWLSAHQDADGMWDSDAFMKHEVGTQQSDGPGQALYDVGVTGLALLSFLAEGSTPNSGEYRDQVGRGLHWLCKQQDSESGLIGTNHSSDFIYNHALASLAVIEAYAMTGNPELGNRARSALRYLENHRHPHTAWRYQPGDEEADLSITYWCASAYLTADWAGLQIDEEVVRKLRVFLGQIVDPATGRGGYLPGAFNSSRRSEEHAVLFPRENGEAMTAAALFLKFMLGDRPDEDPTMAQAAGVLGALPPAWSRERMLIEQFYWMVGSQALRQYGGVEWLTWKSGLRNSLVDHQIRGGKAAGSWDPLGPWGREGGRVYSTAICLLALQAEYRYADFFVVPARPLFSEVGAHWRSGEFDRVAADLEFLSEQALPPMDKDALEELKKVFSSKIDESIQRVELLSSGKVGYEAIIELEELERGFGDLEPGELAAKQKKRLMREPAIKREVDANKRLQELLRRSDRDSERGRRAMARELNRLVKRYPGTQAGKEAKRLLEGLKED